VVTEVSKIVDVVEKVSVRAERVVDAVTTSFLVEKTKQSEEKRSTEKVRRRLRKKAVLRSS